MHDLRKAVKLNWWPSLQDYNEAIQMPLASLQDPELRKGLPYTGALGLPRPVTGSFASVYRMHCTHKDYALRLFLRNFEDQAKRYALISDFVQHDDLPYTVTFDFLANGIQSRGEWFPALKMEWVEGTPFEEYIVENLKDSHKLGRLLENFVQMMNEMRAAGIAHGDLQHGNIIMCQNEIRLVDYDGMFVPAMKNFAAKELGHPNYQHPTRGDLHFGPYLDNFSAWIIYASIRALQIDPGLLNQLGGCDDCLLFRRSDFINPLQSAAFAAFEQHENEELQSLGRFIRAQLTQNVAQIPYLQIPIPESSQSHLTPIADNVSSIKSGPRIIRSDNSDWLKQENLGTLPQYEYNSPETYSYSTINKKNQINLQQPLLQDSGQASWIVQHQAMQPAAWVKPVTPLTPTSASPKISWTVFGKKKPLQLISPDLLVRGSKRALVFDKRMSTPPIFKQCLMLINPLVWFMVFNFYNAFTIDENLRVNATEYKSHVTSVNRYVTHSKNSTDLHTDVDSQFTVNGKRFSANKIDMGDDHDKFKVGQVYPIRALASNPAIQEPLNADAGTNQKRDEFIGNLLLLINLLAEYFILRKLVMHRSLAKKGLGMQATVAHLIVGPKKDGVTPYFAFMQFTIHGQLYNPMIKLDHAEYQQLQIGSIEDILYDPDNPNRVVIYKFCMFKPAFQPVKVFKTSGPGQASRKP